MCANGVQLLAKVKKKGLLQKLPYWELLFIDTEIAPNVLDRCEALDTFKERVSKIGNETALAEEHQAMAVSLPSEYVRIFKLSF